MSEFGSRPLDKRVARRIGNVRFGAVWLGAIWFGMVFRIVGLCPEAVLAEDWAGSWRIWDTSYDRLITGLA